MEFGCVVCAICFDDLADLTLFQGPDADVIRLIDFCFLTLSKRLTNRNRRKD